MWERYSTTGSGGDNESNGMRTLLYDLETSPNLGYTWGLYEQNVIEFLEEWQILCFAYKWADETTIHTVAQRDMSEKAVTKELWKLFDEADVIVAHNGDQFDRRKANAKFAQFNLGAPSSYRTIDTKKVAKRYFGFNSNKLTDLGKTLGLGEKLETGGFETWKGCMAGDEKAWAKMLKYNKQDVALLEQIYLALRPFMVNHPNVNTVDGTECACPTCGSERLQKRGTGFNQLSTYQRYVCKDCRSWSKGRPISSHVCIKS